MKLNCVLIYVINTASARPYVTSICDLTITESCRELKNKILRKKARTTEKQTVTSPF